MALHPVVRRAIADRQFPRARTRKSGSARVSVVVRLDVDPARIKKLGGRDIQINLTAREASCLQPFQTTLFDSLEMRRDVRLIVNRRRATVLSVTNTGILVFAYGKIG